MALLSYSCLFKFIEMLRIKHEIPANGFGSGFQRPKNGLFMMSYQCANVV